MPSSRGSNQPVQRYLVFFLLLFTGWTLLDLVSKSIVFTRFVPDPHSSYSLVDGYVYLIHIQNEGAVWGILQEWGGVILITNFIIVPLLFWLYARSLYNPGFIVRKCSYTYSLGMALVLAGACGNMYDRVTRGFVRDFIDVMIPFVEYRWPAFNLADAGISTGFLLILFCLFRDAPDEESPGSE